MTNLGGNTGCAGDWTICGGNSQSYADETVGTALCSAIVFVWQFYGPTHRLLLYRFEPNLYFVMPYVAPLIKRGTCNMLTDTRIERSQPSLSLGVHLADSCHASFTSAPCVMQGSSCASEPTQFNGKLDSDKGVNIMASTECTDEATCGCVQAQIPSCRTLSRSRRCCLC